MTIVTGTPASVNEIQEGVYTVYELGNAINAWLQAEYAAAGDYTVTLTASKSGMRAFTAEAGRPRFLTRPAKSKWKAGSVRVSMVSMGGRCAWRECMKRDHDLG